MIFTLGSYVFLLIPTLKKYDVLAPLKKLLFDFSRYLIEKYAGKETNSVLSFENSSEGSQDENDETD